MNLTSMKNHSRGASLLMLLVLLASPFTGKAHAVTAAPGDLTRVSVDSSGAQANGRSYGGQLSGDGRYVAFASGASNLVPGDTNNTEDIFVKDRQTGATFRVSVATLTGAQANGDSGGTPAISSDGRYVAFESSATNLVSSDTNGQSDVFVRDLQLGVTTLVSVNSTGLQANDISENVSISGDGRLVAFTSSATNLVSADTNAAPDVFVRNLQTGLTTRISVDSTGVQGNSGATFPKISANGRFVVFSSSSTNLVSGDTNNVTDIFVHDIQSGQTTRESVNTNGAQADGGGSSPAISGDGHYVVFLSDSGNLDPRADEYRGKDLVYVHDRQAGQTTLASVSSDGGILTVGLFDQPTISRDGRYVAFSFYDKGDNNGIMNIWVRDLQMGTSIKVNSGNDSSFGSSLSADGKVVAFVSGASNLVSGDTNGVPDIFVREVSYGPERNPTVASVTPDCGFSTPQCAYPTASSVSFIVIFSEQVNGVSVDDFSLTLQEGIIGASITGVRGYGTEYFVSVDTGSGDGKLRLNILDNDSIMDTSLNPLGGAGTGNGDFTNGRYYWIDKSIPTVTSITRADPSPTAADTVRFTVNFSEKVWPVMASDFVLTATGNIFGADISAISPSEDEFTGAATYTVTVFTGTGDGTLRLDLVDNDTIGDWDSPPPLGGTGIGNGNFSSGEIYTIVKSTSSIPIVTSSLRANANPTDAASVNFTVTFSEVVVGVDQGDFSLTTTGNTGGVFVANVSGSGNTYTVTIGTGNGDGSLRLDVVDNDSILNASSFPIGGPGAGNGNFTSGEAYTIDKTIPIVNGILRTDPNPSTADSVHFIVTFSEAASGVDAGDFILTTTNGLSGASIIGLSGSANTYIVTAATGTGNGTLRLDLMDNDSITDASGLPLGGVGMGNGNFNVGEAYTINKIPPNTTTYTFHSNGTNDGWVLESGEDSRVGGTRNATQPIFRLGDDSQDRQYRAILHFPTYYLPDNAVVTEAILMIKLQGGAGTYPFTTLGGISIDIRTGVFGNLGPFGIDALQASDFQNPASMDSVGIIPNTPNGNWFLTTLNSSANPLVNLRGITQIRLAFQLDDNDNLADDYLAFYSGDYDSYSDRPHLVVKYYLP